MSIPTPYPTPYPTPIPPIIAIDYLNFATSILGSYITFGSVVLLAYYVLVEPVLKMKQFVVGKVLNNPLDRFNLDKLQEISL